MRVALIAPESPFLIRSDVHPPLGLFSLGAVLKGAGHTVSYCDRGLHDRIPTDVDVYCLTGTSPQLPQMQFIMAQLRELGKPIIVGGPHATLRPGEMLNMGATAVVQGEGEEAILQVLAMPDLKPGIVIQAKRIANLDDLPFCDRSQAHRYHYEIADRQGKKHRATTIMTARGCPFRCSFCSHALWGQAYVARSAQNVLAELRVLKEAGWQAIHFFDDTITIQHKRLLEICQGLRELGMVWRCFIRGDGVTPLILREMAQAGCVEVGIGLESGSQRILDNIHKGETVEQQRQAVLWAKEAGIRVKSFVILGLPGEDWESVDETVALLKQTRPDDVDVVVLQLYPGSPLGDYPEQFGLTATGTGAWYKGKPGEYRCTHRTEALSEKDILVAREFIEAHFKRWA